MPNSLSEAGLDSPRAKKGVQQAPGGGALVALLNLLTEDRFEKEAEAPEDLGGSDWHVDWVCKELRKRRIWRGC